MLEQTEERCEELGIVDNTLPYTHEELGVCLNLNKVTVSRILKEFEKHGIVKLGQKKIQVLHRNLLQEILDKPD